MVMPKTATEMSSALAARTVSSVELLQETFDRIDRGESLVRSFISFADRSYLMAAARSIDIRRVNGEAVGGYAGIPIAIKDNIAVKGHRLTCGSRMLENHVAVYDSTAASRLKEAGLLIVGKTNMDEFGFGSSTENSAFFSTRNPIALDRVPGGTSGGSAAAVKAGFVPWALGTDTGGSVRQPASLCGVVGMRPTYGRVSRYGLVAYASSLDQIGPLATSVGDTAMLLSLIMGPDPMDGTSLPAISSTLSAPTEKLRIGVPHQYRSAACQKEVQTAIEMTSEVANTLGWEVTPVSLPLTDYALSVYYLIASVEAASNLARYDGGKYGYHAPGSRTWEELVTRSRSEGFGDEAKRRIMLGTFASSAGYSDQYYLKAAKVREMLKAEFDAVFREVDILLSPISPTTAWPLGERSSDPMLMYLSDIYSVPGALAGIPGLVLPVAYDDAGLPIGLQLSGGAGNDALVIAAGKALESAIGFVPRSPSWSSHES